MIALNSFDDEDSLRGLLVPRTHSDVNVDWCTTAGEVGRHTLTVREMIDGSVRLTVEQYCFALNVARRT